MPRERGLQWKRTGPLPSCFMTEGHDVDNVDTKWLCPECHTVTAWAAASSSVLLRGAGRQAGACRGRVGEAARALPGAEEGLPRPEESIELSAIDDRRGR